MTYTAAIVTFRRASTLGEVLRSISNQTMPPSLTVVADNDSEQSARAVVEDHQEGWPGELLYVPVGENRGPAGGWAAAVQAAQQLVDERGDWVLVVDDDDPLESPGLLALHLGAAEHQRVEVAAVGLRGARLNRRRARLQRVITPEGTSEQVDYLASGGAPIYRWDVIDQMGFFRPDLFFGFEDLDYGLRLKAAGYHLLVTPRPSLQEVSDTSSSRSPWREYYKTRAFVWILKHHVGHLPIIASVVRSVLGGFRLAIQQRSHQLLKARVVGALDGYRGLLGSRRYRPSDNPPKQGASR